MLRPSPCGCDPMPSGFRTSNKRMNNVAPRIETIEHLPASPQFVGEESSCESSISADEQCRLAIGGTVTGKCDFVIPGQCVPDYRLFVNAHVRAVKLRLHGRTHYETTTGNDFARVRMHGSRDAGSLQNLIDVPGAAGGNDAQVPIVIGELLPGVSQVRIGMYVGQQRFEALLVVRSV